MKQGKREEDNGEQGKGTRKEGGRREREIAIGGRKERREREMQKGGRK